MVKKRPKRTIGRVSDEEDQRIKALQGELDAELPYIREQALRAKHEHDCAREIVDQLSIERKRLGLSLADLKQLSGIQRETISKLENASSPNPTIRTLTRLAHAMGKRIEYKLIDNTSATSKPQISG